MGTKRSAEEPAPTFGRQPRQQTKRTKLSPTQEDEQNSSEPSSCSVSEDSALHSSPSASEHTRNSSFSSAHLTSNDDDRDDNSTSTSSESSDSSDSKSDSEVTTIGGPRKPQIRKARISDSASDLRTRLAALLPQMAKANRLLDTKPRGASIEDVDEGEQHIEMDLGLGVLEEQNYDESTSSSSESSDEDAGDREKDVLGRLMGTERARERVGIEDIE